MVTVNIKHVLLNTLFFTILSFLPSVSAFFILPFVLDKLSSAEYGQYVLLNALVPLFSLIGSAGIGSSILTHYFKHNQNLVELKKYKATIYSFLLLAFILSCLIVIPFGNFAFKNLFQSGKVDFFPNGVFTFIGAVTGNIFSINGVFLRNDKNTKHYSVLVFSQVILTLVLQIYFIQHSNNKLEGLLNGRMIGNLLIATFILIYSISSYGFSISKSIIATGLRFSLFYLPASLLTFFNSFIDKYTFERLLSLNELGVYGLIYTLSGIIEMAYLGISSGIQPYLFERLKNQTKNYNFYIDIFIYTTLAACCMVIITGYNIDLFSNKQEYLIVKELIFYSVFTFFVGLYAYIYNLHFFFFNKPGYISIINFITVLAFVMLCFLLIPKFGLQGCLLALIIQKIFSVILSKVFYQITHQVSIFNIPDLLYPMIVIIGSFIIHWCFQYNFYNPIIASILQFIWFTSVVLLRWLFIKKNIHENNPGNIQ